METEIRILLCWTPLASICNCKPFVSGLGLMPLRKARAMDFSELTIVVPMGTEAVALDPCKDPRSTIKRKNTCTVSSNIDIATSTGPQTQTQRSPESRRVFELKHGN